jgi:hypothetical protein
LFGVALPPPHRVGELSLKQKTNRQPATRIMTRIQELRLPGEMDDARTLTACGGAGGSIE